MIKKGKRALGIVTAAALSISFALPVLAAGNAENTEKKPAVSAEEETKEEQVKIYWDSEKGTEDGDGSDRDHAVKDLKKAVKLLKEAKEKAEEETAEEVKESSLENASEQEAVLLVVCSDKELTQEESDYLAKEKAAYITLADLEKQEEEKQAESSKEEEASKEEEDSQEETSEENEEKPDTEETQDSQEQTEESTEEANDKTTDEIPEDTSSISTIISAKDNSSTEADSVETKLNTLFLQPMQIATSAETSLIQEESEKTEDSQEQTEESSSETEEESRGTEENQQEEPSQEETTEEAAEETAAVEETAQEEVMAISLEEPVALQAPVNTTTSLMRALPGRDLVGTGTVNRKNSAASSATANVVSQQQTTANSSITPAPVKTGDEDYYYLPLMICLTFGVGALVMAEKMSIDKERAKLDNKYSRERTEFSESCDRDEKTL